MARGFRWGVYVDNVGNSWALLVDADHFEDGNRGWTDEGVASCYPLPRGWLPRRAAGWDQTGRVQTAVIASVSAPLWTRAAEQFFVEANDNTIQIVQVTALLEERRRGPAG